MRTLIVCALLALALGALNARAQTYAPPPPVTDPAWDTWINDHIQERLDHCPRERSTSYYFAQSGHDTLGDGSIASPFRTLAKAQQVLDSHPLGDVAVYFRRGDTWREPVGLDSRAPNVTIADYGDPKQPKPVLTPFTIVETPPAQAAWVGALDTNTLATLFRVLDRSPTWTGLTAWSSVPGHPRVYRTDRREAATWVREGDDLDRPLSRQDSIEAVAAEEGSWYWSEADLAVYVHPLGGQDPRLSNSTFEIVGLSNAGVEIWGDGSRVENIVAIGWGMLETTPSQRHGIQTRAYSDERIVVVGCESYYGSSHCMTQQASGGAGGDVLFLRCKAGFTTFNGVPGETVFNTFSQNGVGVTVFAECTATHGTLPSSDWDWRAVRRGGTIYGHASGAALNSLCVAYRCGMQPGPHACERPASFSSLPQPFNLTSVRGFIVGEFFDGGFGTGDMSIAPNRCVRAGGRYLNLVPFRPNALYPTAISGWAINNTVELDLTSVVGKFALYYPLEGTSSSCNLWHNTFLARTGPHTTFLIDFRSPHRSQNSTAWNNVIVNDGPGLARPFESPAPGMLRANAYYGMSIIVYATDNLAVALAQIPPLDTPPDPASALVGRASALPNPNTIYTDQLGPVPVRETIGPFEP